MRINMNNRKSLLVLATILLLFLAFMKPMPVRADQSTALLELNSARLRLSDCYAAAKAAESASANISALTNNLNSAGYLFSRAEFAYSIGDFDAAQNFASQSQNLLSNFISNAKSLEDEAALRRDQDFLFNTIGSIAGFFAVIIGSFGVWILLKRRFGKDGGVQI
jgi:hypothetical protein